MALTCVCPRWLSIRSLTADREFQLAMRKADAPGVRLATYRSSSMPHLNVNSGYMQVGIGTERRPEGCKSDATRGDCTASFLRRLDGIPHLLSTNVYLCVNVCRVCAWRAPYVVLTKRSKHLPLPTHCMESTPDCLLSHVVVPVTVPALCLSRSTLSPAEPSPALPVAKSTWSEQSRTPRSRSRGRPTRAGRPRTTPWTAWTPPAGRRTPVGWAGATTAGTRSCAPPSCDARR